MSTKNATTYPTKKILAQVFGTDLEVMNAPGMPSLSGVAAEWEACETIRNRLRKHKRILDKDAWADDIKVDVKGGEMNYEVLRPLVKRLLDKKEMVGMHTLPAILAQSLACFYFFNTFSCGTG